MLSALQKLVFQDLIFITAQCLPVVSIYHSIRILGSLLIRRKSYEGVPNRALCGIGWVRFLNQEQVDNCLQVLKSYLEDEASIEWHEDLDDRRILIIKRVKPLINEYLSNQLTVGEFKTKIDSISKTKKGKREEVGDLWGFKGIKGMMFFNLLHTACELHTINLDDLLKPAISLPSNRDEALSQMKTFYEIVSDIQGKYDDRRKAPNPRSVPYFLTYFWQIQDADTWPIQYTSMERAFEILDVWTTSDDIIGDYDLFLDLMIELKQLFSTNSKQLFNLWKVEHVFWRFYNNQTETALISEVSQESDTDVEETSKQVIPVMKGLPKSYVPPIISVIPRLAKMDPELDAICKKEGKSISKELEERVARAFTMLGLEVTLLGQGQGRVPDGIALCREYHYAIIYDTKATQYDYSIGTDSRAFIEYIRSQFPLLRKQGIEKIFFVVVSGTFSDRIEQEVQRIKMTPGVQDVVLLPAESLVKLVEIRLRSEAFDLGHTGLLSLLTRGGLLLKEDIDE